MNNNRFDEVVARMERREAVLMAEQARMDEVRSLGFVPDAVGPEIPVAPARGPVRIFESIASYPKGEDGFEMKAAGFMGRKTLRCEDSFDLMAAKVAGHKKAPPFRPAQVT